MASEMRPIAAAVQSGTVRLRQDAQQRVPADKLFVTISRQAGAGGVTLGQRLATRLNELSRGERPWQLFDRELVEKVAADHDVPAHLVESWEGVSRNWLSDLVEGLTLAPLSEGEFGLYRRVKQTIEALAESGRVIIVGRGGVYITRRMAGGIHINLVAPQPFRIARYAELFGISSDEAARRVPEIDQQRQALYRRYWPNQPHTPELFTATLNTAELDEEQMVQMLTPALLSRQLPPR